jgi:isoleucyl-tRNA synthetase
VLVGAQERLAPLGDLSDLIADEANVKEVGHAATMERFLERKVKPNMSRLGPRFKGDAPRAAKAIHESDGAALLAEVEAKGSATLPGDITVTMDDLVVGMVDRGGFRTQKVADISVVLDVRLDEGLVAEGFTREVVRRVQEMRKEMDLDLEEPVHLAVLVDDEHRGMLERHLDHLREEVRADPVTFSVPGTEGPTVTRREWDVDGVKVDIALSRKA